MKKTNTIEQASWKTADLWIVYTPLFPIFDPPLPQIYSPPFNLPSAPPFVLFFLPSNESSSGWRLSSHFFSSSPQSLSPPCFLVTTFFPYHSIKISQTLFPKSKIFGRQDTSADPRFSRPLPLMTLRFFRVMLSWRYVAGIAAALPAAPCFFPTPPYGWYSFARFLRQIHLRSSLFGVSPCSSLFLASLMFRQPFPLLQRLASRKNPLSRAVDELFPLRFSPVHFAAGPHNHPLACPTYGETFQGSDLHPFNDLIPPTCQSSIDMQQFAPEPTFNPPPPPSRPLSVSESKIPGTTVVVFFNFLCFFLIFPSPLTLPLSSPKSLLLLDSSERS